MLSKKLESIKIINIKNAQREFITVISKRNVFMF